MRKFNKKKVVIILFNIVINEPQLNYALFLIVCAAHYYILSLARADYVTIGPLLYALYTKYETGCRRRRTSATATAPGPSSVLNIHG
ncbi:hypothetical protein QTP88_028662 [Uroleucon formosanum]